MLQPVGTALQDTGSALTDPPPALPPRRAVRDRARARPHLVTAGCVVTSANAQFTPRFSAVSPRECELLGAWAWAGQASWQSGDIHGNCRGPLALRAVHTCHRRGPSHQHSGRDSSAGHLTCQRAIGASGGQESGDAARLPGRVTSSGSPSADGDFPGRKPARRLGGPGKSPSGESGLNPGRANARDRNVRQVPSQGFPAQTGGHLERPGV